jgi:hypothetical protein
MSILGDVKAQLGARMVAADLPDVVNVYTAPPRNPSFPHVLLLPGDPYMDRHMSFSPAGLTANTGPAEINLIARLVVSASAWESAIDALDDFLSGTNDVFDAIEGDYVLTSPYGGTAHVSEVVGFAAGEQIYGGETVEVLSIDLLVKVYVRRIA